MSPPPVIVSESKRMEERGWGWCEGCGRKMLKDQMIKGMCVPCSERKRIKSRDKKVEVCLQKGVQKTL